MDAEHLGRARDRRRARRGRRGRVAGAFAAAAGLLATSTVAADATARPGDLLGRTVGELTDEVERTLGDLGEVAEELLAPATELDDAVADLLTPVEDLAEVPETVGAVVHGLSPALTEPLDEVLASFGLSRSEPLVPDGPFSAVALELPPGVDAVLVRAIGPLGPDAWQRLELLDLEDGPDPGTAEAVAAGRRAVTDLAWVGVGTALEVVTATGTPLDEVTVHLTDSLGLGAGLLEELERTIDGLVAELTATAADPARVLEDPAGALEDLLATTTGTVEQLLGADVLDGLPVPGELDPLSALLDVLTGAEAPPSPGSPPPSSDPAPAPGSRHWTDGFRASAARPAITSRAGWGADESWRRGNAAVATPRFAVVHHTATSNGYGKAEAPAVVRAMYRHHTQTLGWNDLGYNLVVDRYGRVYEGRAGGVARGVVGAHASGHNRGSFGVAIIGNFETASTTRSALRSLTDVVAWKYRVHGISPDATATTTHDGRRLPTLVGHRDVGSTACPGRHVTKHLPELRRQVARAR